MHFAYHQLYKFVISVLVTFLFLSMLYSKEVESDKGNSETKDSIFANDAEIKVGDKPVMIIFSKKECYHCDILDASLMQNATIQGYISLNFTAYYITIGDKKKHSIPHLNLSGLNSTEVAQLYGVTAIPLIVFISSDSKEIMRVSGFPGERRILDILEYINNDMWKKYSTPKERVEGFLEYEKEIRK